MDGASLLQQHQPLCCGGAVGVWRVRRRRRRRRRNCLEWEPLFGGGDHRARERRCATCGPGCLWVQLGPSCVALLVWWVLLLLPLLFVMTMWRARDWEATLEWQASNGRGGQPASASELRTRASDLCVCIGPSLGVVGRLVAVLCYAIAMVVVAVVGVAKWLMFVLVSRCSCLLLLLLCNRILYYKVPPPKKEGPKAIALFALCCAKGGTTSLS